MSDDAEPMGDDEIRLLAELGRALGPQTLPDGLLARADGLLAWMDVDDELQLLLEPSAPEAVGAIRGAPNATIVSYESADGAFLVELVIGRDVLDGQILAGAADGVTLEHSTDESQHAAPDALGRFAFPGPSRGPARLRLRAGSEPGFVTPWFLL
jgi:hypothetical protein